MIKFLKCMEKSIFGYNDKKEDMRTIKEIAFECINVGVVNNLLYSIYEYDECTYCHSINTALYSLFFCSRLDKHDFYFLKEICISALLHDVGKVMIDKDILNKTGILTEREYAEMKKHPAFAMEMLEECGLNDRIRMNIYHHHERLNGKGYPEGIHDPNEMCQIVSFSDVVDALSTKRPYKRELNKKEVCNVFKANLSGFNQDCFRIYSQYFKHVPLIEMP